MIPRQDEKGTYINVDEVMSVREGFTKNNRVIFLSGVIGDESESCNTLMMLDTMSHDPIKLVITSPGGVLDAAVMFYDTMRLLSSPIYTLGRFAASAAVMLLAAGSKRYVMPHSKTMLHLLAGGAMGDLTEIKLQTKQAEKIYDTYVDILVECGVKKSARAVKADIKREREVWMDAEETIKYGLADEVMDRETLRGWLS